MEKITEMTDAIGHPIVIGDYVTAVWANGEVALFQVAEFKANTRTSRRYWARQADIVMLKREFKDENIAETTQNKLVQKQTSQVTWVDPNYVMLKILAK